MSSYNTLKEKGKKLLQNGAVLIDTSNRTEEVNEKDVIAIKSLKSISYTILFSSEEKKKIKQKLIKKGHSKGRVHSIMHAVEIYYILINYIDQIQLVYICPEGCNKGTLENYLKQFFGDKYPNKKINIQSLRKMFGKKNIAHKLALKVKRSPRYANIKLQEHHFRKLGLL